MTDSLTICFALALGYLFGSIPFGLVLTRAAGLGDIRKVGSGNIGATNVLRTGNMGLAAATLAFDMAKGAAAVLLAREIAGASGHPEAGLAAGLGAILGHTFPVWLQFQGGKGVATYIGVLAAVHFPSALAMCAAWIAMAAVTRYSSLSALAASAVAPFVLWFHDQPDAAVLFVVLTLILVVNHRDNIRRLLSGEESKIGGKP